MSYSREMEHMPSEVGCEPAYTAEPEKCVISDSLTRQTIVGVTWSALSRFIGQALSLVAVGLLARLLGPSAYGLMGMATLVLVFLGNFRDLGTATAIIQRAEVSSKLLSSLFWVNCSLGLLLTGAAFLGAVPAAAVLHEPKLAPILRVACVSFCFTTMGAVPNALLARRMQFDKIAIADLASAAMGYSVSIPCAYMGMGVWSLVIGSLANIAAANILYIVFCRWRPSLQFDAAEVRAVSNFSLNLAGFGIVNYFSRNADNIIVGRTLGPGDLGYYQMAYNLFLFPIQNVTSIVAQVLNPAFSRIQTEDQRFRSAYIRGCMLIGLITFPIMAGLGVVADPFIRVLLGDEWAPVIPVLQILVPVGIFQSVQGTVGQIYVGKGRTDWMFRVGLISAVLFVVSFFIGVRWGTKGVATAYCVTYFVFVLYPALRIPFSLIGLTVGEFFNHLLPQIAITLGMVAICMVWMKALSVVGLSNQVFQLGSTVVVGVVSYVISVLSFRLAVIGHLREMLAALTVPRGEVIVRFLRRFER
jgi:O-antigen/teichoic acid export membrane protein